MGSICRRLFLLFRFAVVGIAVMMLVPAAAAARVESEAYVGGPGDVDAFCGFAGRNFGGACFDLDGSERTATIWIDDLSNLRVGGLYVFRDAGGAILTSAAFCGSTFVPVPGGAVELAVQVDETLGPVDCPNGPLAGEAGAGTAGSITVYFRE